MRKIYFIVGLAGFICSLSLLLYLSRGSQVNGYTTDLLSITNCELNTGPRAKDYVAVVTSDATLVYFSFIDIDFSIEKATETWEIISLIEPPSAKPYSDFSAEQITYFHYPISKSDTSVVGILAKKNGVLLQAFSSRKTGVSWGLLRGVDFRLPSIQAQKHTNK